MSEQEESSGSDVDSNDEVIEILHKQQELMISMLEEVDKSLHDLHHIRSEIHHSQDLFTHLHLQETLQPLLQRWATEQRISDDGFRITLSEEEQKEFDLPSAKITIYEICERLVLHKTMPK